MFQDGSKRRPAKWADPVRLRGDPAFLDRTSKRALSAVPVCRTSGSPAAPATKRSEDRAGTARGLLSSTLQPARTARLYVLSLARKQRRATCLRRVQPAVNCRSPTPKTREKCARPATASSRSARLPQRNTQTVRGAVSLRIALNFPASGVRVLSVYFSAASRPIELSLQSSFQLSLMVLVVYRSRA